MGHGKPYAPIAVGNTLVCKKETDHHYPGEKVTVHGVTGERSGMVDSRRFQVQDVDGLVFTLHGRDYHRHWRRQ